MKAARRIINKKVILIGLLLLANLIGFVVARNYFNRNACMTCEAPHQSVNEPGKEVQNGSGSVLNWTYTLIQLIGSGKQIR